MQSQVALVEKRLKESTESIKGGGPVLSEAEIGVRRPQQPPKGERAQIEILVQGVRSC